ncbi:P-type conjugative transfer protein TrbG [Novosphingobium sp. PhB55]|uniref:P-type conjugative transfer protein TrbG n=1 Tax=Novosphingobium sp. PhB55 TaxID=2485106 RepID=UPI001FBB3572|nr:P-type conjugative transfer protein TrbG [Novosphingobium sp. PhB55]
MSAAALAAALPSVSVHALALPHQAATEGRGWVEPASGAYINARQMYLWSDGAVYRIYTQPGMITDIALQAGEALVAVAAGDTARWVIGDTTSGGGDDKRTHVLVKPFSSGLATNLVITTDKRTYHVSLTSSTSGGMAALAWNYPLDEMIAVKRAEAAAEAAKPVAAGLGVEQLYFGYQITGDRPSWRPLRAFDDGRQTFIEFPLSIGVDEAPPLFLVGEGGVAELVNYRMRGRFYVVDRIFAAAELRFGSHRQQVVRITRGPAGRGRP